MTLLDESEIEDFWSSIADAGYSKDDFELTESEDSPQTSGVFALRGKAIVRRKSTEVTRQYMAGHGTAWVGDFDAELRGGIYGHA